MASGVFSIRQQAQAAGHGAWAGSQTTPYVEYLVVAGGGGGGDGYGSGAGAGGLLQGISNVVAGSSITITVGSGGTGSTAVGNNATQGGSSVFGSISTVGGGVGLENGSAYKLIQNGGSGGGGSYAPAAPGQGTFGQGNAGGLYGGNPGQYLTPGGGGAGTIGFPSTTSNAGNGGAGIASSISGTVTVYAGGGGGGTYQTAAGTQGSGGVGGGGSAGTAGGSNAGVAGTANTGGGGGGASYQSGYVAGGSGGSGIVIISYPDTYNAPTFGGANNPTSSTSGSGSLSLVSASSQYVSYAQNSAFNVGSGNFTVELWFYANGAQSTNCIIASQASGIYYTPWMFYSSTAGALQFYSSSNGSSFDVAAGAVIGTYVNNTWNHAVICRSGTSIRCYLNGVLGSTTTTSATLVNATTPLYIGMRAPGVDPYFNGYVSNFRLVTGTAVYTAGSFTSPTAPLTAISGTQLLLNTVSPNQYLDSSSNAFTATPTGSPTWNQASPFATGLGYKNRVYTWTGSGTVTF
jgi:hypothetical protein